jgi:SET and MYND domain-containing protein
VIRYLGLTAPEELVPFGINSAAGIVDLISRVRLRCNLLNPFLSRTVSIFCVLQFATNSITLTSPSLTPLGVCVSPLIALVNHSCDPNAVVVFPRSAKDPASQEPEAQVIAIRDISPGKEVSTETL